MHNGRKVIFGTIAWLTLSICGCASSATADDAGGTTADKPKPPLRHFITNARVCLDANFAEGLAEEAEIEVLVREAVNQGLR